MTPLRIEAPAKVNLSLGVAGRRGDGFHLLVSDLALLELADRMLLMPGCAGLRVEGAPPGTVPVAPGENLAWRGLLAGLQDEEPDGCLTLEKRIPAAAGLGGGSSDAAAAWRLGRRWRGADDVATAGEVASLAAIGADVAFFAAGVPAARVTGIGERVEPHRLPADGREIVLAHPGFALPTAAVYAELRAGEWSGGAAADGANDLLRPALRLRPELSDLLRLVVAAGGRPQLSGSGPTVFARTDDPERAAAIAARLGRAGVRATLTRLRHEAASIEVMDDADEVGTHAHGG